MARVSEEYKIARMQVWRDIGVTLLDGIARNPIFSGVTGYVVANQLRKAELISDFQHGVLNTAIGFQVGNQAIAAAGISLPGLAQAAGRGIKAIGKATAKGFKALKNIRGGSGNDIIIVNE